MNEKEVQRCVESSGFRVSEVEDLDFYRPNKEMNAMENRDDFVEIVELTIEELEERTAPGVIIWG